MSKLVDEETRERLIRLGEREWMIELVDMVIEQLDELITGNDCAYLDKRFRHAIRHMVLAMEHLREDDEEEEGDGGERVEIPIMYVPPTEIQIQQGAILQ